jgi:hypothetical protein
VLKKQLEKYAGMLAGRFQSMVGGWSVMARRLRGVASGNVGFFEGKCKAWYGLKAGRR